MTSSLDKKIIMTFNWDHIKQKALSESTEGTISSQKSIPIEYIFCFSLYFFPNYSNAKDI
jgi:hypothetical protein